MAKMNFGVPPPKKNYQGNVQKFVIKNEKNQSCSKMPEMARKLVENKFWTFSPPPKKNNYYLEGVQIYFFENEK